MLKNNLNTNGQISPIRNCFSFLAIAIVLVSALLVTGCSTSAVKARKEQRDKSAQAGKLYCEFVNGEVYPTDLEIVMNLEMQKRCDNEKPFSVTNYRTPSENSGLVYCCTVRAGGEQSNASSAPASAAKKEAPKAAAPTKAPDKAADKSDEIE